MEKSYKPFAELVTKLKHDEFFGARLKLTFFYALTALGILLISSVILYQALIANIQESVSEASLDPRIAQMVLDRAGDILQNKFILTDSVIMLLVIIVGFLLTQKTLTPIWESMQRQKRFIADASHELRTPITIALSGLEVALRNKEITGLAKDTLSNTLVELEDLAKLTNHMLDFTKQDLATTTEHLPIIMSQVVTQVTTKMKPVAAEKGVGIQNLSRLTATILGNQVELERVLYNILNNAVSHTPKGGMITIADSEDRKNYVITIADTGVGIAKGDIGKVFDPFFQSDSSRHTGGSGLGLTLAKKIIENHKGDILIKSQLGLGTEVIISLPKQS